MKACTKLPKSHKGKPIACIELEHSKVLSRLIKIISVVLAAVVFLIGFLILPKEALVEMDAAFVHLVSLMLGMMAVLLVHELLRGLLMRIFSGVKPIIRYAGSYPHAACEAYFDRGTQQIINILPPVITAGMLIAVLLATQDMTWKWMIWLMLTVAVSSFARDFYVAFRIMHLPKDILVMNVGPTYLIYSAESEEK